MNLKCQKDVFKSQVMVLLTQINIKKLSKFKKINWKRLSIFGRCVLLKKSEMMESVMPLFC